MHRVTGNSFVFLNKRIVSMAEEANKGICLFKHPDEGVYRQRILNLAVLWCGVAVGHAVSSVSMTNSLAYAVSFQLTVDCC